MITSCPHCGQKVRVQNTGKYRCPHCREVFEHDEAATEDAPSVESDIYVEVPGYETVDENDPADLYVDESEQATACETCGRPGADNVCNKCGAFVCKDCAGRGDYQGLCPKCIKQAKADERLDESSMTGQSLSPGFIDTFVPRLKAALFSPSAFFSTPSTLEAPSHQYLFAVICYCVGGIFALAYNIVFQRTLIDSMDAMNIGLFSDMNLESMMGNPGELFIQNTLFLPIMAMAALFFLSGIIHLCLMLFGRPTMGFSGTIRVVAYSNATHLLQVIPFLGGLISFVWQMAIIIIGTSVVHKMTNSRTAIAVLTPFILLFLLGIILALAVLPAVLESMGM